MQKPGFALLSLLLIATPIFAQTNSATLSGSITDPSEAVIAGAELSVMNLDTGVTQRTKTNPSGQYLFASLPPGTYKLSAKAQGFKEAIEQPIVLHVQDAIAQNLRLELGTASESVQVSGNAAILNTQDATVGTVIERQIVENMPLNGRSFQGLITLSPGVATVSTGINTPGQVVVNGQRNDTNYFSVDGVSANVATPLFGTVNVNGSGSSPTNSATGGFNNMVSLDALEEFRISTSSFAPEFGRTPGGQISLVTRGGTNGFHGDVFDYFRNTALDANDWFLNAAGKARGVVQQNDFGGVLGGPILKNKLFFFASYEGLRLQAPSPTIKLEPTQDARAKAASYTTNGVTGYMAQFLNAYPLPDNNPPVACTSTSTCFANYTFSQPGTSQLDSTSGRIDWTLNQRMSIFGRYNHAPSSLLSANSVTQTVLGDNSDVYTAGWTTVISSTMTNDVRFNFTHATFVKGVSAPTFKGTLSTIFPSGSAQPPAEYLANPSTIAVQFGPGISNFDILMVAPANSNNGNDQYNLTETLSWVKGKHALKFGADYRQLAPAGDISNFNWNTVFGPQTGVAPVTNNFCPGTTIPGFICGQATLANIQHNVPQHFLFRQYSFFVQDTYKLTTRLTLTYGMRYEVGPAVEYTNGYPGFSINAASFNPSNLKTYTLNPFGAPAYATRWGNVAPRVGAAYQLSTDPKWGRVVRAGYGIFYDTGLQVFGLANNPWNARCNNQAACGSSVPLVQFPVAPADARFLTPPVIQNPPPFPLSQGSDQLIDPTFKLPYVHEMNVTVEQQLGPSQTVTVAYVGAFGRRLIGTKLFPPTQTNPAVLGNGLTGDTIRIYGNYGGSDYSSLQTKFQRQFTRGLAGLASYTWSHSLDNTSVNSAPVAEYLPTAGQLTARLPVGLERASSDFDVRHNLALSVAYNIPNPSNSMARVVFGHWSVDPIYHYQTATPFTVVSNVSGAIGAATGLSQLPNLIPGVPVFVTGSTCAAQYTALQNIEGCPGGKALNIAPVTAAQAASAGCAAPTTGTAANAKGAFCTPLAINGQAVSGNFTRNAFRGFSLQEFDLSMHRDFPVHESIHLRFQADAFNVFNHPQFGPLGGQANNATFGLTQNMANAALGSSISSGAGFNPIFSTGGPRNFQFALKLLF